MGEGHLPTEGDFGMMYLGRIEYLPLGLFLIILKVRFTKVRQKLASVWAAVEEAKGIRYSWPSPSDGGTDTQNVTADLVSVIRSV